MKLSSSLLSIFIFSLMLFAANNAFAQEAGANSGIVAFVQVILQQLTNVLDAVLFYNILGFPFLVLWLVSAGVYFTLRLGFVNIRMFRHGLQVMRGKFTRSDSVGEVTPFAALSAAVAGTVGLGNIAGVAVAISLGGPGAVVWMMLAGLLGMSTIFAEVTLGHKYRKIDENGRVSGGAFHYLSQGLAERGLTKLGKGLAVLFAVLCIGGALGGGNLLQSNQLTATLISSFELEGWALPISTISAVAVGVVLIGGVKRIGCVAEAIVPLMACIYLLSGVIIIALHASLVPDAIGHMFAMAISPDAAVGGIIGVMVQGFRRAAFSNEAGVGSTPIVFAATKADHPASVGALAVIAPFVDTMVVCLMTGLVIIVTGVYETSTETGVVLTGQAFSTVASWFPMVLSVCVTLFAFSTMLTWSYYGERAWGFLFGSKHLIIYHIVFCALVFFGGAMQDENNTGFAMIVNLSDLLLLSMAIPNLVGVYVLQGVVAAELKEYWGKLKGK